MASDFPADPDATVVPDQAAAYLSTYIAAYRQEFERFTAAPPDGGGYPALAVSPYITKGSAFHCLIAPDGTAITNFDWEPPYEWQIAGGPALMPDLNPTRVPSAVLERLRDEDLLNKQIGISRLVAPTNDIPDDIWHGRLPPCVDISVSHLDDGTSVEACAIDLDWQDLIARLTFGALGYVIDPHLPTSEAPFWTPQIISDLGFVPADRNAKRFFHYLELAPHVSTAAWDVRTIWARVHADVRRDFASYSVEPGGRIRFPSPIPTGGPPQPPTITQALPVLETAIAALAQALQADPAPQEDFFQELFEQHPVLLDVYGTVRAHPRLPYPEGGGPTGKSYVEPDFVVIENLVSGHRYRLIEIERPGKQLATGAGHSRVALTQAAWQIGEWKAYIANHYDLIRDIFPGIPNFRTCIIISRATEAAFGGAAIRGWMEIAKAQLGVDEILLYDDVLRRAQSAYDRLLGVSVFGQAQTPPSASS